MQIVQEGQLKGAFKGFKNTDTVFEFTNGRKWRQAQYYYLYHYAYMPSAKVVNENGQYVLMVDGVNAKVPVRQV